MKLFVTWWTQQKRVSTHLSSYIKQEFVLLQFKVLVPALFSWFYLWTFQQLLGRLLAVNVDPRCIIVQKGGAEMCKPWQTRPHEWTWGPANTSCVLPNQEGLTVPPLFLILRHNIKLRFFCWITIDASIYHHIGIWPSGSSLFLSCASLSTCMPLSAPSLWFRSFFPNSQTAWHENKEPWILFMWGSGCFPATV